MLGAYGKAIAHGSAERTVSRHGTGQRVMEAPEGNLSRAIQPHDDTPLDKAVSRFGERLNRDKVLAKTMEQLSG